MCFREEATPIIILITDAFTHNGPENSNPYSNVSPTPHSYDQTIAALSSIDAHVLVISTRATGDPFEEMYQLATDTGGVDESENPIVLNNISSTGEGIINIMENFCFH